MIGIAFSLGFTVGPLMGAYFAMSSKTGHVFYQTPALLALAFSAADLLFIWLMLPETLTKDSKVSESSTAHYLLKATGNWLLWNWDVVTETAVKR